MTRREWELMKKVWYGDTTECDYCNCSGFVSFTDCNTGDYCVCDYGQHIQRKDAE